MNGRRTVSNGTIAFATLGTLVILASYLLIRFNVGGDAGATVISDLGQLFFYTACAAVLLRVGLSFPPGERTRREWVLIGAGVGSFAFGMAIWSYTEVVQRQAGPFPGAPDIFFSLMYVFLGAGILLAAAAYWRLAGFGWRMWAVLAVTAGLGVVLYMTLLRYLLADPQVGALEKFLSTLYPVGDLLLLVAPALMIILILLRGRLGWPWWGVVAGAIALAVTDTSYSLLELHNAYQSGSIVDYGWMIGFLLIAIGGSLERDVARPSARPRTSFERSSRASAA